MAKIDLGVKRHCQECDVKFYDLGRTPITCPKCGAVFKVETPRKSARAVRSAAPAEKKEKKPIASAKTKDDAPADATAASGDDDKDAELESGDSGANAVMEDTSELGEDADDVAEVVESSAADEKDDV